MKNIYLVGFMGSGKSTVGKIISKKTGTEFIDIDTLIEKREKKSIKEIFETKGEQYFRDLEKSILRSLIKEKNKVISTGGGLGANQENMKLMKKTGTVVWLDLPLEEIFRRCGKDKNRPLLNQPLEAVKKLYEERKKVYSLADVHIKAYNRSPEEIAEEIIEKWRSTQE